MVALRTVSVCISHAACVCLLLWVCNMVESEERADVASNCHQTVLKCYKYFLNDELPKPMCQYLLRS